MSWPPWEPRAGDLVSFDPRMCIDVIPIRVAKSTTERFMKVAVSNRHVFIVLGQLDFETKLETG